MNDILLATLPAALVLVATFGARFVEHYLQGKREAGKQELEKERETRDARRQYRANVIIPIKEALGMLGSHLRWNLYLDSIREVEGMGISVNAVDLKLKEDIESMKNRDVVRIDIEILPKLVTITNQDTRKFLERVFRDAYFFNSAELLTEPNKGQYLNKLGITVQKMEENIGLAYQKLEDYVALAD